MSLSHVFKILLRIIHNKKSKKKIQIYIKDFVSCNLQAMEHLQSFIQDCDARTEIAKKRLKETQEELSEEANSKVGT